MSPKTRRTIYLYVRSSNVIHILKHTYYTKWLKAMFDANYVIKLVNVVNIFWGNHFQYIDRLDTCRLMLMYKEILEDLRIYYYIWRYMIEHLLALLLAQSVITSCCKSFSLSCNTLSFDSCGGQIPMKQSELC